MRRLLWIGVALALAGCGGAGLDVRYPDATVNPALLSSAPPRRVEIGPVIDRRADTRLGVTRKDGKPIVTSRPVVEIVRDALAAELVRNGHAVVAGERDAALSATVEEFRLDEVGGYGGAHLVGRVVIALSVIDARGDTALTRRYVGIKRRDIDKPTDDARRETMDAALARAMHDLATDPELARVLGGGPRTASR